MYLVNLKNNFRMKDCEYKVNKIKGFFNDFEVFEILELGIYIIEIIFSSVFHFQFR